MEQEYQNLVSKEIVSALEVSLFTARYGGTGEGANLASVLFDKLNNQ